MSPLPSIRLVRAAVVLGLTATLATTNGAAAARSFLRDV